MWKVVELLLENIGAHVDYLEGTFRLFFFIDNMLQFPFAPHRTHTHTPLFIQFNMCAFSNILKR
jgi:hypothetical protein